MSPLMKPGDTPPNKEKRYPAEVLTVGDLDPSQAASCACASTSAETWNRYATRDGPLSP
jgi:hypothetical protein